MIQGDTIASLSSPAAACGRIVLRLSGPRARGLGEQLCSAPLPPRGITRAVIPVAGLRFPAWLCTFAVGASYTGEEVLELHLPGNPLLADLTLRELLHQGARLAEAGEFTARAFFNGRLDLTEAEGVAATIAANSERELLAARRLCAGELAQRVKPLCQRLTELLALTEAGIDFSQEDIRFITPMALAAGAAELAQSLRDLLRQSVRLERLCHTPVIVLAGRANAGKSTLLNALCGRERVVVSAAAGTTRDVVSAPLDLPHGRALLIDMAGLSERMPGKERRRETGIHRQMQQQSLRAIATADVVLWVREVGDHRPPLSLPATPACEVITKGDLSEQPPALPPALVVSVRTGQGLALLRQRLDALAFSGGTGSGFLALNARHVSQIDAALASLERVQQSLQAGDELAAFELREALDALGQITGLVSPDEVLGRVFSTFCIGK